MIVGGACMIGAAAATSKPSTGIIVWRNCTIGAAADKP
jgi:hypothetical protein